MIGHIILKDYILNICNNYYKDILALPNVIGMALSLKIKSCKVVLEPCIQVLVEKKIPIGLLNPNDIIPSSYMGITTDVFETGIIESLYNDSILRPALCGYSIGPSIKGLGGTAGAIVKGYDNLNYILSNNHVFCIENTAPIGTPILQPSMGDGGVFPDDIVATLSKFVPIKFIDKDSTPSNLVDCAIACIADPYVFSPYIHQIGVPKGIMLPNIGQRVIKSGRTTGLTSGTITSIGGTVKVKYAQTNQRALYKNQILTTPMSSKGDSGSLLMSSCGKAIGLLFSGSTNVSLYNNITNVLSSLNVELVTDLAL